MLRPPWALASITSATPPVRRAGKKLCSSQPIKTPPRVGVSKIQSQWILLAALAVPPVAWLSAAAPVAAETPAETPAQPSAEELLKGMDQNLQFETRSATITMTVNDNHFGGPAGGDRVGIAEVVFTNNVPEPGSLALLGLGGLLIARRRRA